RQVSCIFSTQLSCHLMQYLSDIQAHISQTNLQECAKSLGKPPRVAWAVPSARKRKVSASKAYRDTNGAVNVYGLCGFSTHWPGGHCQGTPSLTLTYIRSTLVSRNSSGM